MATKKIGGEEVIAGDNRDNGHSDNGYGNPYEHWKPDFKDAPSNNDINTCLLYTSPSPRDRS